jgi:hypothetical protein
MVLLIHRDKCGLYKIFIVQKRGAGFLGELKTNVKKNTNTVLGDCQTENMFSGPCEVHVIKITFLYI